MKIQFFKIHAICGLFFIFIAGLAGNAYADANQIVYYNWCEDTGNTIVDSSEYGNNGINNGSTTFILPTEQVARHFNGKSRITIPDNEKLAFNDPNITCGVFFRYNSSNPARYTCLVSKGNNIFKIGIDHRNSTLIYEFNANDYTISGSGESRIQPDKDYEAIVTYDGSHAQLYLNGIANGKGVNYTAAAPGPDYITDQGDWTIGSSPDAAYGLNGSIYAFYLYNRTLNPSEILNLYGNDLRSIKKLDKTGGIALSWDDSAHIETCYPYLSIFQKYNATCTINVNKLSTRSQAVINELNALHSAGWEVACHGYNHVNSVQFVNDNPPTAWLSQEIFPNIAEITRYGYPVCTLAYPYSSRNADTDAALSPYFRTLRTRTPTLVNGNVNETTLAYYKWDDSQLLYGVEIDDRSGASLQSIEDGIDYAIKTGTVLVLYGHMITPNVTISYQTSTDRLDSILDYTSRNGGVFYNMGDLGNSSWVPPPRFSSVTANYEVSRNSIFAGKSVIFKDCSVNQTTELLDFGDGSPVSNSADVIHTYTTPGVYTANLTVSNDVSSDSMLQTITVISPTAPTASFTSNSTTGPRPLSVAFNDTSTGLPESWLWDFGDGNTSTLQNPVKEYSFIGNYTVKLTVENEFGSDYIQKVNYITALPHTPSSNFSSNTTYGNIPLIVQFKDTSTGSPASWLWNFGDECTSTEQNPVHTYSSAGTYDVTLITSNADGTDSKTATITALSQTGSSSDSNSGGSSGSGSGSSGGSGGGAGSPEPAKNVKVKELSQAFITSGNPAKFDFTNEATDIVYLCFDPKKTVGKTTTIIEMLKSKSTLTPETPEGEVYNYLNIWVGNGGYGSDEDNLENGIICFKVEKDWIKDKEIDKSSIILNRYSDKKWNELPTAFVKEDNSYLYFTAETPGFSPFAITARTAEKGNVIGILPETSTQDPGQKNGITASDIEKPGDAEKTDTLQKEKVSTPGFGIISCIIGLLGAFLYKRR